MIKQLFELIHITTESTNLIKNFKGSSKDQNDGRICVFIINILFQKCTYFLIGAQFE